MPLKRRKPTAIVDSTDTIIGHKKFRDVGRNDIYRVAALWIVNKKGDVLLARRSNRKSHDPGKWGPAVAGTVEEGETYNSNVIKEAKEDLGLGGTRPKKTLKLRNYGKYNFFCQWFVLKTNRPAEGFRVNKKEVKEIRWFPREELLREIHKTPDQFLDGMNQWAVLFGK